MMASCHRRAASAEPAEPADLWRSLVLDESTVNQEKILGPSGTCGAGGRLFYPAGSGFIQSPENTLACTDPMSGDLGNFKSWYADVLAGLYGNRSAGLAVFMLSLPLAERYLRQKCGLGPEADFDDRCIQELRVIFPALPDVQTARQFWTVYRNGFLHQATLSRHTKKGTALPVGWLTHDIAVPVKVEADGSFWVHPVLFSQQIIREIEGNFTVFAGAGTTAPPLPTTVMHVASPGGPVVPPVNISTRGGT